MDTQASGEQGPELHPDRPKILIPKRVALLPIDPQRGVPVPWFVHWDDEGKPEFRVVGKGKFADALRFKKCWVCGQERGKWSSFVIGPMCGITRTTAEPPCHRDCAIYSACACPFLSKPRMHRRPLELDYATNPAPGTPFERNPGVALVWTTDKWKIFADPEQRPLIQLGDPQETLWFAQGRPATRQECEISIEGGFPLLDAECDRDRDPADSRRVLNEMRRVAEAYLPPAAPP